MIEAKTDIKKEYFEFPDLVNFFGGLYEKLDKIREKYETKQCYVEFGKSIADAELAKIMYLGWWDIYCPIFHFPKNKDDTYYVKQIIPEKPKVHELFFFTLKPFSDCEKDIQNALQLTNGLHIHYQTENKKWKITRIKS